MTRVTWTDPDYQGQGDARLRGQSWEAVLPLTRIGTVVAWLWVPHNQDVDAIVITDGSDSFRRIPMHRIKVAPYVAAPWIEEICPVCQNKGTDDGCPDCGRKFEFFGGRSA